MSVREDGRIEDAREDFCCVRCGDWLPRGYRHFACTFGDVIERYHVHCARDTKIQARCLGTRSARCRPLED